MFPKHFENDVRRFNERWVGILFGNMPVTADMLTIMGLLLTIIAFWVLLKNLPFIAGMLFLVASSFDAIDGALARYRGETRPFGAFLDSVVDRYSELIIFLGIMIHLFLYRDQLFLFQLISLVLSVYGSLMTSYIRARAEALGFDGRGGIIDRPIRVIIISFCLLSGCLDQGIIVLAFLTNLSAFQRFFNVWKQSRDVIRQKEVDQ